MPLKALSHCSPHHVWPKVAMRRPVRAPLKKASRLSAAVE
jgi:hypothetical protein